MRLVVAHEQAAGAAARAGVTGYVVTRVPAYRLGLRLLGGGSAVYAASVLWFAGTDGVMASVGPVAFALMCWLRLLTIGGR